MRSYKKKTIITIDIKYLNPSPFTTFTISRCIYFATATFDLLIQ